MRLLPWTSALVATSLLTFPSYAQDTIKIVSTNELTGTGSAVTTGNNFENGVKLAVKEINAAGGILGKKIELIELDTQSSPGVAKAMAQKAVDLEAYAVVGPTASGSTMVSMLETKRAEIPNFTGGEAAPITMQGNPYIFRTSFGQNVSMPKLVRYMKDELHLKSVAVVWQNNEFGKGGRDVIINKLKGEDIKVTADIPSDPGQVDFSAIVLKVKQSNPDALFAYVNEEESARLLREIRKLGFDKPLIGETTLLGQKVIELAGDAANGVRGHVGLTVDAPLPSFKAFNEKFFREYNYRVDHNGMKGYFSIWAIKAGTEKVGKVDRKEFAKVIKNSVFCVKDQPGLLLDVKFDEHGDIDRESFLVRVQNGKQEVTKVLPPLDPSWKSQCK